jgi:hypothetical protein
MQMSGITIEFGNHVLHENEQEDTFKKTLQGDDGSHFWPSEVRHRMAAYKPDVIAVDSIEPVYLADGRVKVQDKANIWTLLPGKPSELNGTEQIHVVAGDDMYGETDANTLEPLGLRLITRAGLGYVGYKALTTVYKLSRSDFQLPENPTDDDYKERRLFHKRQMTRRRFIGMCGVAAGITIGISGKLSGELPRGRFQEVTEEVGAVSDEVSLDRIINPNDVFSFADGRTALIIAKMKDVIGRGSFGLTGSVVLGTGHLAHSRELLHSGAMRDRYIRRHAELLVDKARKDINFYADSKGKAHPEDQAKDILKYHRKIQVFEVLEPDDKRFKSNPKKEIDRIVRLVDSFVSPSVTAATEGILHIPRD